MVQMVQVRAVTLLPTATAAVTTMVALVTAELYSSDRQVDRVDCIDLALGLSRSWRDSPNAQSNSY
jgi:hypothetical protein